MAEVMPWTDGESLVPLAKGAERSSPVAMEYAAEGTITPMVALRQGAWKYIHCPADPDMLFDVTNDPDENHNLAQDPRAAEILAHFRAETAQRWNLPAFDAARWQEISRVTHGPEGDKPGFAFVTLERR